MTCAILQSLELKVWIEDPTLLTPNLTHCLSISNHLAILHVLASSEIPYNFIWNYFHTSPNNIIMQLLYEIIVMRTFIQ